MKKLKIYSGILKWISAKRESTSELRKDRWGTHYMFFTGWRKKLTGFLKKDESSPKPRRKSRRSKK